MKCFLWIPAYILHGDLNSAKVKFLSPGSVLLLILMKLIKNVQNQELAYHFGISRSSVNTIPNDGLAALAENLVFLVLGSVSYLQVCCFCLRKPLANNI